MKTRKIYRVAKLVFFLVFLYNVIPHAVFGADLIVGTGGDYTCIQDALDDAQDGDTIIVKDGTYTGEGNKNLNFNGKSLTLKSENGPYACIIDCEGDGRGIFFQSEGGNDTVIGFTIQNANPGNEVGGAIRCLSSSPTIRNCILKDNRARNGGGIYGVSSSPTIEDCQILDNYSNVGGAGVFFYIGVPKIIGTAAESSIISGNHTLGNGGGIYGDRDAFIRISKTTIEGNQAGDSGGGIYGVSGCTPTITDCSITGNSAGSYGGGMYLWYSSPVIEKSIIKNNVANSVGGIYSFKGSSPSLTNCVISHNTSSIYAGGILFYQPTSTPSSLVNCTICNNTGGGITFKYQPDISIKNCIIWGNGSYQLSETGYDVIYSLVGDGVYGEPEDHNISGDPLFEDAGNDDYHLKEGSPCIGAGIHEGAPVGDIEGYTRSLPPCIGAYEADQVCYQLTIDPAPVNGSITDIPKPGFGSVCTAGGYSAGSIVTVTAHAAEGYHFDSWSGDAAGDDNPLTITMDGDKTITATFAEGSVYSLTLTSSAGGSITPNPDKAYYEGGEQVTLTAVANTGYRFDSWSGDASGEETTLSVVMDSDKTITAEFIRQYSLTVDTVGGGSVTVSPDDGVYDQDTTVSLTAEHDAGWEFDGWSGDAAGNENPITILMDSNKNITATFRDPTAAQYTLTVNVVGGGSVSPDSGLYYAGQTEILMPRPYPDCEFLEWSGDAWGNADPLTITMDSDKTITATFSGGTQQYSLDLTGLPAEGGSITPNPDKDQYAAGEQVTLTAVANTGYSFDGWSGDATGNENPLTITMNNDKSISALFSDTATQYELTVTVVGGGRTYPGNGYYNEDTTLNLTATPYNGWEFDGWSGDLTGNDPAISVLMDSNKHVTATFRDATTPQYTLAVTVEGQGSVTPDSGDYYQGEQVFLNPEPEAGWEFAGWSGDASGAADPLMIVMDTDKNITATFIESTGPQYTLTLSQSVGGSISANPSKTSYNEGDEVELTAVVNTGYSFDGWSGDATGNENPLTIIMDADKTVSAVFVEASVPYFTATPDIINSGEDVVLKWFTPGEFGSIDGQIDPGLGWVNPSEGSYTVTPNQTTQYTLKAKGEPDRTVTVFVLGDETEVLVDEKTVRFSTTGGLFSEITPSLPAAVESPDRFPFGLFDFTVTGLTEGEEIRVRVIMPEPIPAGAVYFKFQDEALLPYENVSGLDDGDNMFDITLVDGGAGDADNEINGEIKTIGGLAWVTNLYFPHIACSGLWKTEIGIINDTGEHPVAGQLKLCDGAGEEIGLPIDVELGPHGRKTFYVNDFADAESISHILFTADYPSVIMGYTKFYQDGVCGAAVPAVAGTNQGDIHITHIASVDGWRTGVSLVNTTRTDKEIDIVFNNGSVKTRTIPAGHRDLFSIRDLFDGVGVLPDLKSATIQNAGGIVGLEIFMHSNLLGGTLLRDVTAQKIYYPHVACDDDGWGTGIVAYNPLETPCDITITSYSETGENMGEIQEEIPGYGRYCELVKNTDLPVDTAWLELTASQNITGLELFSNGAKLAGYTSVDICSQKGVFPDLKNGGATGIAFVNTGSTDTVVTLTAYDDEGKVIATINVGLNAYCKTVRLADDFFPEDITDVTYISYESTTDIAAFRLSASSDNMMLDALPCLH